MALKKRVKVRLARLEATKEKRAQKAQYARERKETLLRYGLCIYCGKEKAVEGLQSCPDCRLRRNARTRERREKNKGGE